MPYVVDGDGPDDMTPIEDYVFVYRKLPGGAYGFVRARYDRAVCGDCDATYDPQTWVWDEDGNGDPMLVCECGGQMYSTCEEMP